MALDLGIFAAAWMLLAVAALAFSVDTRDGEDWSAITTSENEQTR